MSHYFDQNGEPISLEEWSDLIQKQKKGLAKTSWSDGTGRFVSTVWLGLDHGFGMGDPLIFETMAFGFEEEHMRRYSTKEEALKGHDEMVEMLRSKL